MNWTVFHDIFNALSPPVLAAVASISAAMVTWVAPAMQYGLIVYLAARWIGKAIRRDGEPLSEIEAMGIKAGIALYVAANLAGYTSTVTDILLTNMPRDITSRLSGAMGGVPITDSAFDAAMNKAFASGLLVLRGWAAHKWLPNAADFGFALITIAYIIAAVLAISYAFVIWLKAFILLALLIAVGPLAVGLFAFPFLSGLFERWLGLVLSKILLQVFCVTLLSLLLIVESKIVGQIAVSVNAVGGGSAANQAEQVGLLVGGSVLFAVMAWTVHDLPNLAAAIGGGVATTVGRGAGLVYGTAGWALGSLQAMRAAKAAEAAGRSTAAAEAAQVASFATPPGLSMSD